MSRASCARYCERHFAGAVNGQLAVVIVPLSENSPRLHWTCGVPVNPKYPRFHICRLAKSLVHVPANACQCQREICPVLLEEVTVASGSLPRIDKSRQRLDFEFDRRGGILGGRDALCQNNGDRLAGIAHLIDRNDRLRKPCKFGQWLHAQRNLRHRADFSSRYDADHIRHRRGRADRKFHDFAVGIWAAQNDGVDQPRPGQIVNILTPSRCESQIFATFYGATDPGICLCHGDLKSNLDRTGRAVMHRGRSACDKQDHRCPGRGTIAPVHDGLETRRR